MPTPTAPRQRQAITDKNFAGRLRVLIQQAQFDDVSPWVIAQALQTESAAATKAIATTRRHTSNTGPVYRDPSADGFEPLF